MLILELWLCGILYITCEVFSRTIKIIDKCFYNSTLERNRYDNMVRWFETHDFFDAMSPYIKEYLETGKLDQRFYEFDDELISFLETELGLELDIIPIDYLENWKETIMTYKKSLIMNLKQGKDYYTSKGTIRIVKVRSRTEGFTIDWYKDFYGTLPYRLQFEVKETSDAINILGYFGFTFIPTEADNRTDIVSFVNLGTNENS